MTKYASAAQLREMDNHLVMPRTLAGQEQKSFKKVCTHIKGGTFVWTDSQRTYDGVLSERNCPHKELKSGLSYDQVNHLNTVNSLHSKINEVIRQYRNVSSIYINRYAALFSLQQRFTGFEPKEIVLTVVK